MENIIYKIEQITNNIIDSLDISFKDAEFLANLFEEHWFSLIYGANKIKQHFRGNKVQLCSIVNAKSGNCSEDCKFCAQSAHHNTQTQKYDFVSKQDILDAGKCAYDNKASGLGIVTSGEGGLNLEEKKELTDALKEMKDKYDLKRCASLGVLTYEELVELKNAGLQRFHHNLETSKSFFKNICTTHDYDIRLKTVQNAKKAGLEVCCGGIFGLGENMSHRLELAFEIKELDIDAVPLNFLIPVLGTPLENLKPLTPREILMITALFRFILPDKQIKVCAGRQSLRSLEAFIFTAGADGMMIGDYLTMKGQKPEQDFQMLSDLGLAI